MGTGPTTSKQTTDLLGLPLAFTQRPILDPGEFIKECELRGIKLTPSLLEDLHRHQILVPFFRVGPGQPNPRRRIATNKTNMPARAGVANRIVAPANEGRLFDPAKERFRRWPRAKPSDRVPRSTQTGYWYGYHQMLTAIRARGLIASHKTYFHHPKGQKYPRRVELLDPAGLPDASDKKTAATLRSLAVLLSALETRYWPEVVRQITWPDEWTTFRSEFDPTSILTWLGSTTGQLEELVTRFTFDGSSNDPSGELYDLIRRCDPQIWQGFRGDLRVATDYRAAAEMIHLFLEDLDVQPSVPTSAKPLGQQRLSERGHSLDESLTRTGLSPHPSLVIGVEGETEMEVVPKVFETLDVVLDPSWIRIENYRGVDRDLQLLAQFAGSLSLGQDRGPYVTLARPVSRMLVLADQEKKYATAAKRRAELRNLLDAMTRAIPHNLSKHLRSSRLCLCSIRTWGKYPFEFAHFTDGELADAIVKLRPKGKARAQVIQLLAAERRKVHRAAQGNGPNVDRVLKQISGGSSGRVISKPELATVLWPVLEGRILAARVSGKRKPPVMKAVERAIELATMPHRSHMVLAKA